MPEARLYELNGLAGPNPIEAAMYSVEVRSRSMVRHKTSQGRIVVVLGLGKVHCAKLTLQPSQFWQQ